MSRKPGKKHLYPMMCVNQLAMCFHENLSNCMICWWNSELISVLINVLDLLLLYIKKVKLSCYTPCRCWGGGYSSCSFLTSALDGSEWSASHPGHALPVWKDPGNHWAVGWVGLRVSILKKWTCQLHDSHDSSRGKMHILCTTQSYTEDWHFHVE